MIGAVPGGTVTSNLTVARLRHESKCEAKFNERRVVGKTVTLFDIDLVLKILIAKGSGGG